jgi:hypothetical protein
MFAAVFWFLVYLLGPPPAAQVAVDAGKTCERGCIVGAIDGWVYEITRDDLVWATRAAHCEIEIVLETEDAPATLWALTQNFYRRHLVGRVETFGEFVSMYSACTSRRWATGGDRYSPRVTPIADVNRRTRWRDLPQHTRNFVRSFFAAEIPNRWPGWVYVWTHGWERHAAPRLIGPYYAVPLDTEHSLNAYYSDPATKDWGIWTVRIAPATGADTR